MAHQDMAIAEFYVKKIQSSNSRGIEFDLSFTAFKNMARAKKCHFTGLPLTANTFSIDRVDNSLGYVKGNVVACHRQFNNLKGMVEDPNTEFNMKHILKGFTKINKALGGK